MLSFKGLRFPIDVILLCIRWCAAYPLSYRQRPETVNLIGQGLLALRDQSWNVPNRVEDIQDVMGSIAVDVDRAQESYGKLTKVFGDAL